MSTGTDERLARVRTGRARMHEVDAGSRTAIADLDVRPGAEQAAPTEERVAGSRKLAEAERIGREMEQELRGLCAGVIERLESIGLEVTRASEFRGPQEKVLAMLGKMMPSALDRAQRLRMSRLEHASVEQSVAEVRTFVEQTIAELGEVEEDYRANIGAYGETIDHVLTKLREATPRQLAAERKRQELEGEYNTLDLELRTGTLSQAERPEKEARFEALKRQLEATRLEEIECVTIVNEAQRALPELQKNKDAAARSIESIHGMRRNLLEKTENLTTVLANAMTAVRARARLERYQAVDPAFNATIEAITTHNIAVAGAAMEVAAERLKRAAIDPARSQELLDALMGHVADFLRDFAEVEDESHRGVRAPRKNGPADA